MWNMTILSIYEKYYYYAKDLNSVNKRAIYASAF